MLQIQQLSNSIFQIFFLYFHNLFKKKHTGISFIDSHPEIIEIKEQLINYTKTSLTTENVAKNIIAETLKYYT